MTLVLIYHFMKLNSCWFITLVYRSVDSIYVVWPLDQHSLFIDLLFLTLHNNLAAYATLVRSFESYQDIALPPLGSRYAQEYREIRSGRQTTSMGCGSTSLLQVYFVTRNGWTNSYDFLPVLTKFFWTTFDSNFMTLATARACHVINSQQGGNKNVRSRFLTITRWVFLLFFNDFFSVARFYWSLSWTWKVFVELV